MNTPTPNNAARATPVAWQERHRKSDGSWDNWRMCTKAYFQAYAHSSSEDYQVRELVPAATVAALEAEVAENEGVIAVWRRRCEEAERRVGELEAEVARQASSRRVAEDRAAELELKQMMLASRWRDEANAGYLTGDALIDCATTNRQSVFFQCANELTGADPT